MSRRRKARVGGGRTKRSNLTRTCPTGKRPFRHKGDAEAFLRERPNPHLTTYQCEECGEWHLGGVVPRSVRRRRTEEGKTPWPDQPTKGTP